MVQFIRGSPDPRSRIAEQLGLALGEGLGKGVNAFYANKALEDVLSDKSLQNASPSTRLGVLQQALMPYGEIGRNVFKNRLEIESQQQKEREQNVLSRVVAGDKVPAEELSSLSPQTQLGVIRHLQHQEAASKKINADTLASQSFSKGYRAILDGDLDTLKEVIDDPLTPLNVKTQLGSIQNQFSQRKDIAKRDENRRINNVQNAYGKAINSLRNLLGKTYRPDEKNAINQKIEALEADRQKDMQNLLKNPGNYGKLAIWGNADMRNYLPENAPEDEFEQDEEAAIESEQEKAKVLFNPKNSEHVARAKQVLAEVGGDRSEANKILAQEFIK